MKKLTSEQFKILDRIIPVFQVTAWSGFTNQPANDAVEVVSSSASDTGKITIFGTTYSTGAFAYETITLNGITAVATTKTDWGNVYGTFMGDIYGRNFAKAVGTITIREGSGDLAITTIAAGNLSKGLVAFDLSGYNVVLENITGNTFWNIVAVPTADTGGQMAGRMSAEVRHKSGQYLYLISDATGSTAQVYVYEAN